MRVARLLCEPDTAAAAALLSGPAPSPGGAASAGAAGPAVAASITPAPGTAARRPAAPPARTVPASADLDALAAQVESGALDGVVVPYLDLRVGRFEPTFDLLTRRRALKVNAGAVVDTPRGRVMFARIGTSIAPRTGHDRTLLLAHLFDRQGVMYHILRLIYENDINISHLNNRPDEHRGQFFYFDLECHADDDRLRRVLSAARDRFAGDGIELEVLGSCPMVPFFPLRIRRAILIGGTHGIGPLIGREFFEREGVGVVYAGRNTRPPYAEIVDQFDCVMFAVPLDATVPVIRAVAPRCRPGSLLIDLASRKGAPVAALLEAAPAGCEVLGVHTVFGPQTASVMGKDVIAVRTPRSGPLAEEALGLFKKRGVVYTESTAEEHDRLMRTVQTQWHRLLLACLLSARASGLSLEAFLNAARPPDEAGMLLYLGARILALGDALLWGLQTVDGAVSQTDALAVETMLVELNAGGAAAVDALVRTRDSVSADARMRCAAQIDGVLFTLYRAQERSAWGRAPAPEGAAALAARACLSSWKLALQALPTVGIGGGDRPAALAGFSSPHFLLGLMAGFALMDRRAPESERPGSRAVERRLLEAHRTISDIAGRGRRDEFVELIAGLRRWLGDDFVNFAVDQTTRVFEQVLVQQVTGLPRF